MTFDNTIPIRVMQLHYNLQGNGGIVPCKCCDYIILSVVLVGYWNWNSMFVLFDNGVGCCCMITEYRTLKKVVCTENIQYTLHNRNKIEDSFFFLHMPIIFTSASMQVYHPPVQEYTNPPLSTPGEHWPTSQFYTIRHSTNDLYPSV